MPQSTRGCTHPLQVQHRPQRNATCSGGGPYQFCRTQRFVCQGGGFCICSRGQRGPAGGLLGWAGLLLGRTFRYSGKRNSPFEASQPVR
jgi:hypothetical protein